MAGNSATGCQVGIRMAGVVFLIFLNIFFIYRMTYFFNYFF